MYGNFLNNNKVGLCMVYTMERYVHTELTCSTLKLECTRKKELLFVTLIMASQRHKVF